MYLKRSNLEIILRIIISCILFTGVVMCFAYIVTFKDTIQWYWLGLCVSYIFIGLILAMVIVVSAFIDKELKEYE